MTHLHIKPLSDSERGWYFFDAKSETLGRLATRVAVILRGKHKPTFSPQWDMGDNIVVINCAKIQLTGGKEKKKMYKRHTGYPGGLKEESFSNLVQKRPTEPIRKAVWGMLPKNRLRKQMIKKLYLFAGAEHAFQDKNFENA